MAILHRASVTPSKRELAEAWLDEQPWAVDGGVEMLGSYRFDDPAGEVGVEAMLVRSRVVLARRWQRRARTWSRSTSTEPS
jgi:hypothetical protein